MNKHVVLVSRLLFVFLCLVFFAAFTSGISVITDPTLFSYANEKVTKSEFLYVYEKHNSQDSARFTKKSIDEYLDLYINLSLIHI